MAFGEGHGPDLVLRAPCVILERVDHHLVPSGKARVEVKSDVTGLRLSTAQIDGKTTRDGYLIGVRGYASRPTSGIPPVAELKHS